jgi:glycosyltransferase involved in cell wall biosynthesis
MDNGKLKILLVYDVSYPHVEGGGQRRMFEVAKRLAKDGHHVSWLCFRTWDDNVENLNENGINYIGISGFRGLYRGDGSRRRLEPVEFFIALLRSRINFREFDVVWSGQWPLLHLVWWLSFPNKLGQAKLVVDWWEIWGGTWFKYSKLFGLVGYLFEKFLIDRISNKGNLVLISPGSFARAKSLVPNGRMYLINNGIDSQTIIDAKCMSEDGFDIAFVGRLKNHKRVDLLLSSMGILKDRYNLTLTAAIVGDGPEMSRLVNHSKDLGLESRVKFFGSISSNDQVYGILKSCKISVNPSIKEGGGSITLFESYAAGLPVLAFACEDGIDPELFSDFGSTCLCKEVSAEALAESINSLLCNSSLLESMKSRVRLEARQYDWEIITDQYRTLFSKK